MFQNQQFNAQCFLKCITGNLWPWHQCGGQINDQQKNHGEPIRDPVWYNKYFSHNYIIFLGEGKRVFLISIHFNTKMFFLVWAVLCTRYFGYEVLYWIKQTMKRNHSGRKWSIAHHVRPYNKYIHWGSLPALIWHNMCSITVVVFQNNKPVWNHVNTLIYRNVT